MNRRQFIAGATAVLTGLSSEDVSELSRNFRTRPWTLAVEGQVKKPVEFITLLNPEQMPGQRRDVLEWPYLEGLRMDEAIRSVALHY